MFNINWPLLILRLLPVERRRQMRMEWLRSLLAPFMALYNSFLVYREGTHYKLQFTGQIIYLERLLNDQFNAGNPAYDTNGIPIGIYITDPTDNLIPVYVWNKIEVRPPLYLYNASESADPVYLRNQVEFEGNYEYIVNVPIALGNVITDTLLAAKMRGWLNIYNIAGKRYKIINYTP